MPLPEGVAPPPEDNDDDAAEEKKDVKWGDLGLSQLDAAEPAGH